MSLAKRRARSIHSRVDTLPSIIELESMLRFSDMGFSSVKSYRGWLIIYLQVTEILLKKISIRLGIRTSSGHDLSVVYDRLVLSKYSDYVDYKVSRGMDSVILDTILTQNFVAVRYINTLTRLTNPVPLGYVQRFARNLLSLANELRIK